MLQYFPSFVALICVAVTLFCIYKCISRSQSSIGSLSILAILFIVSWAAVYGEKAFNTIAAKIVDINKFEIQLTALDKIVAERNQTDPSYNASGTISLPEDFTQNNTDSWGMKLSTSYAMPGGSPMGSTDFIANRDNRDIRVVFFNAGWLQDDKQPQYNERLNHLVSFIITEKVDIVGLSEIENNAATNDILKKLNAIVNKEPWQLAFSTGQDMHKGQHTALLAKRPFVVSDVTTFDEISGSFNSVTQKPSEVLGVRLTKDKLSYYVIVARLLSRSKASNDIKRAAQADAVRQAIRHTIASQSINYLIVMGDFNDFRDSIPLRIIRGLGDSADNCPQLKQFAEGNSQIYSHIHKDKKQLIDHILIDGKTPTAFTGARYIPSEQDSISDHLSVLLRFTEIADKAPLCAI